MDRNLTPGQRMQAAYLGAVLVAPENCRDSIQRLTPAMFDEGQPRALFTALYRMVAAGCGVDVVTAAQEVGQGGQAYVAWCAETVPAISHIEEYEQGIVENYRRGRLKELCLALSLDADNDGSDKICSRMARELAFQNVVCQTMADSTAREWGDAVDEALAALAAPDTNLKTGWRTVDRYGLFQRENVVVIAGRPGGGKTDLALTLAARLSKQYRVLYLTLEETRVRLMYRILAKACQIDHARLRERNLTADEWQSLHNVSDALRRHHNMVIDEGGGMTAGQVRAKVLKHKPDVCVIDHCGLLSAEDPRQKRVEAITAATNQLKQMAKELGIVVVELVQLNRQTDRRGGGGAADLADLKGSGSYEEDANAVLFIESGVDGRQEPLHGADAYREVDIRVAKNRDGETGRFPMRWKPQYHDWTPDTEKMGYGAVDVGGYAGAEYDQTEF